MLNTEVLDQDYAYSDSNVILTQIKKLIGIDEDNHSFDTDIRIHINATLLGLEQIGVPISKNFRLETGYETWEDLIGNRKDLDAIKDYIYIKVKIVFDPPPSSFALDALKNEAREIEWRLNGRTDSDFNR